MSELDNRLASIWHSSQQCLCAFIMRNNLPCMASRSIFWEASANWGKKRNENHCRNHRQQITLLVQSVDYTVEFAKNLWMFNLSGNKLSGKTEFSSKGWGGNFKQPHDTDFAVPDIATRDEEGDFRKLHWYEKCNSQIWDLMGSCMSANGFC